MRRTAEDVDALVAEGSDASAESLVQVALDRNLYLSLADASGFTDQLVADERARVLLEESGYRELQQALRRRAPPRPAAPPLVLGATVGTAALPLGVMAQAVRQPAVLSESESSSPPDDSSDDESPAAQPPRARAATAPASLVCDKCKLLFKGLNGLTQHVKTCTGETDARKRSRKAQEKRAAVKRARTEAAEAADALTGLGGH
jgi:hypothetical protein